jgi:hypothetical protein
MPERIACRQVSENSRTFPPFEKGGSGGISIVRNLLNPPGPLCQRGRYLRLFSDCMPERIACRQVSENSRTFPPFEKGGSGGIFYFLHYRFRFYQYFLAVKIPPAPFTKGGDIRGFLWPIVKSPWPPLQKGEIFWPLAKEEIFRSYLRTACRKGSHAGKFPKTAEHSPPLKKGGQGGFPMKKGGQGEIFGVLRKGEIFGVSFGLSLNPPGPLCQRGRYLRLFSDCMPASFRKQQNIPPPLKKGGKGGFPMKKGGSGGISIVILVTQKSVIPNSPPRLPCHPGKHQRAGHSSNLLPPPAVFPTADSSPRFARFGMTPGEELSSREAPTSLVIPRSVSDEGSAVENTDGRMA